MTFNELADRCLLMCNSNKPALKKLVVEAEYELTRSVDILENTQVTNNHTGQSHSLPNDFKSIILVTFDGDMLYPIDETEISYNTDGSVNTGTPVGYFVRNNTLLFDSSHPGVVNISYNALVVQGDNYADGSPTIPEQYHKDLCYYACALAGAKQDGVYEKFWSQWLMCIENIKNQSADRELIHSVRREI